MRLVDLGFSRDLCVEVLKKANNKEEDALELLLNVCPSLSLSSLSHTLTI
jgi:UBA/TS-N domain